MQNHYNLVYREEEREMIPQCVDQGVGRAAVEPARARAPGRQPHARTDERLTLRSASDPFGDSSYVPEVDFDGRRPGDRGRCRARRPGRAGRARLVARTAGVTAPIVGATKVGHVEDALAAETLELSADEVARLEEPYLPHAVSGHE